ncbi:hypothetical protein HOLleu_39811 [Holothuria leucospilota]|uniref:Endonuclease/exonuclease/phosphatase domain-containing protein n=1 Tax=Holothuria leucospilota TaxID=206669 RepID=A0A9Q0YEZ2_HOLLE|nr:hypothetical protein HOLleu_39811 [Holothuria leucospilota]
MRFEHLYLFDIVRHGPESSYNDLTFESLCCDLTVNGTFSPIKLVIIYRPPCSPVNCTTPNMFLDEFSDYLSLLSTSVCKLLVVGDFNFHWDSAIDPYSARLKDLFETLDISQYVNESTHVNGHILDLVCARSSDNFVVSVNVSCFLTDHATVHCSLNLCKPEARKHNISYRKYASMSHDAFANDISQSDLVNNPSDDLQIIVEQYDSTLRSILDVHAPKKNCTKTFRPANPWFSPEITNAKKLHKRLERRWRRTKLIADRQRFSAQRLLVANMINEAKAAYYKNKIPSCDKQKGLVQNC